MKVKEMLVGALLALVLSSTSNAQSVPSSVRIVVPFPAGGTTDILARHVAHALGAKLHKTVIVDNRGGASGTIGSDLVAKSAADGATLLLTATHHVINPSLYTRLPYDTERDFAPVAVVASVPNALVVHPSVPVKTVGELIDLAKKQPGRLSFGSAGVGGANHLSGELFRLMADINIVHVPYRGAAPAMNDLLGGHIPMMFDSLPTVLPAAKDGRLRVLAVTSLTRASSLPDIPTLDEAGLKGFEATAWFGLYMPAGNPTAQKEFENAMRDILASDEIRAKFETLGAEPGTRFGEEFKAFVSAEIGKWRSVVHKANIKVE